MSTRARSIRKDLEKLSRAGRLAAPDYMLDWVATSVEEDEMAGLYTWPQPNKKRHERVIEAIQSGLFVSPPAESGLRVDSGLQGGRH